MANGTCRRSFIHLLWCVVLFCLRFSCTQTPASPYASIVAIPVLSIDQLIDKLHCIKQSSQSSQSSLPFSILCCPPLRRACFVAASLGTAHAGVHGSPALAWPNHTKQRPTQQPSSTTKHEPSSAHTIPPSPHPQTGRPKQQYNSAALN